MVKSIKQNVVPSLLLGGLVTILIFGLAERSRNSRPSSREDLNARFALTEIALPTGAADLVLLENGEIWAVGLDNKDSRLAWHSRNRGGSWDTVTMPND